MYAKTSIRTYTYLYVRMCEDMFICVQMRTYIPTYIRTYVDTFFFKEMWWRFRWSWHNMIFLDTEKNPQKPKKTQTRKTQTLLKWISPQAPLYIALPCDVIAASTILCVEGPALLHLILYPFTMCKYTQKKCSKMAWKPHIGDKQPNSRNDSINHIILCLWVLYCSSDRRL